MLMKEKEEIRAQRPKRKWKGPKKKTHRVDPKIAREQIKREKRASASISDSCGGLITTA